jgi:hypothetical protein
VLHGGLVFLAIRRHVYRMPMGESWQGVIGLQVRVFLPGALREIEALHRVDADPALTLELLPPPRR